MSTLKDSAIPNPDLKANINDKALSTVESVTYLRLHSRTIQNGPPVLMKFLEIAYASPFFEKKLQRLSTPTEFIRKFFEACV